MQENSQPVNTTSYITSSINTLISACSNTPASTTEVNTANNIIIGTYTTANSTIKTNNNSLSLLLLISLLLVRRLLGFLLGLKLLLRLVITESRLRHSLITLL